MAWSESHRLLTPELGKPHSRSEPDTAVSVRFAAFETREFETWERARVELKTSALGILDSEWPDVKKQIEERLAR